MQRFDQSPTDPDFIQNPYPFYESVRAAGPLAWWDAYDLPVAAGYDAVNAFFRDRRFGRENPAPPPRPPHQAAFWAVEDHSMLEADPPRHTRLRAQVARAFTSRQIQARSFAIRDLAEDLAARMPDGPFDLLAHVARPFSVRIIATMLGVPEEEDGQLLAWSKAMVTMYQAGRTVADEERAAKAAGAFSARLDRIFAARRADPQDDLITRLLRISEEGDLSAAEVTATCILLLNAGHEATIHTLGNGVAGLLRTGLWGMPVTLSLVEEVLRHDPPLHMFVRHAREDLVVHGQAFKTGDRIGLLIGGANRDPLRYADPARFDPNRFDGEAPVALSLGAGIHFCLGAQLARLELFEMLRALAEAAPSLTLVEPPTYADIYHFHGLERVMVTKGG